MKDEKVLQEEVLSDEQLENVAGGSLMESVNDVSRAAQRYMPGFDNFRNMNGEQIRTYVESHRAEVIGNLQKMFAGYGIEMRFNENGRNEYYQGGQRLGDLLEAWKVIDQKLSPRTF